jgi:hypothetical protein
VLLPFDADGELSEKQKERLEDAKEMLSEAIEEEEEEMEGASPAPAPDVALSIGLLTDLGGLGGDAPAPAPSPSTTATIEEVVDDIQIVDEPPLFSETTETEASEEEAEVVVEDEDLLQAELDEGDFNITTGAKNETTTRD